MRPSPTRPVVRPAVLPGTRPSAAQRAQPWRTAGRLLRALAPLTTLTALTACSGSLLPQPAQPPALYTLDSGQAPDSTAPAPARTATSAASLVVERPRAAPGYDSRRMVYSAGPQQLSAYAFHAWVEPPAELLAPLLVRALQETGSYRAVLLAPSAATGRWRLETQLLRLEQDTSVQPSVLRLELRAVLLDSATRQTIGWRTFAFDVATAADGPVAGAAAARQAAGLAARALARFCTEQTSAQPDASLAQPLRKPERPYPP